MRVNHLQTIDALNKPENKR